MSVLYSTLSTCDTPARERAAASRSVSSGRQTLNHLSKPYLRSISAVASVHGKTGSIDVAPSTDNTLSMAVPQSSGALSRQIRRLPFWAFSGVLMILPAACRAVTESSRGMPMSVFAQPETNMAITAAINNMLLFDFISHPYTKAVAPDFATAHAVSGTTSFQINVRLSSGPEFFHVEEWAGNILLRYSRGGIKCH